MRQSTSAKNAKQQEITPPPPAVTAEAETTMPQGEATPAITGAVAPALVTPSDAVQGARGEAEAVGLEKARKADKADKADKAARKTATDKAEKSAKAEKRAADAVARVKAETKADERATATVAAMFKALGDPTRLRILRYLRAESLSASPNHDGAQENGVVVGDVALHLACLAGTPARKATSTLSHHLKELRHAGLVTMERRGKNVVCAVSPDAVEKLQDVLGAPVAPVVLPAGDEAQAAAD